MTKIAVTGANGFIGAHCVIALLKNDFEVVAVVRDPSNDDKTGFLKEEASKIEKLDNLSFAAGDLYKEGSYDEAFKGCHGVLHTAAVVEIENVKDPDAEIVRPSVEGTTNVLKSVKKNLGTVKRYVHFSSVAAVQSLEKPKDHVFVDTDWNTWSTLKTDPYGFAKTSAEKLIWDDEELQKSVEVVALNPAVVLGPCLCKAHTKSSTVLIRQILYGNPILNYNASFVDVRDVASAAALAFQKSEAAGKRFLLCSTEPSSTMVLNDHVKKVRPWVKGSPAKFSPTAVRMLGVVGSIPLLSQFGMSEFQKEMFERLIKFDATQSKELLGVLYTPIEDTCGDTVDSMKDYVKVKNWGGEK